MKVVSSYVAIRFLEIEQNQDSPLFFDPDKSHELAVLVEGVPERENDREYLNPLKLCCTSVPL